MSARIKKRSGTSTVNPIDLTEIAGYVNENIDLFHARRLRCVQQLKLSHLVNKNPYLFRAKNMTKASELVEETMAAFLSSSEEKDFGDFLEGLAIFVASKALGGRKSASPGIDLELVRDRIHYVISIKSGTNWGNSSQQAKLADDFKKALIRLRQGRVNADAVLGICLLYTSSPPRPPPPRPATRRVGCGRPDGRRRSGRIPRRARRRRPCPGRGVEPRTRADQS